MCRMRIGASSLRGDVRFIESLPKVRTLATDAGELMLCHGVLEDD